MQSKKRNKRETRTTYLFKRERCDEEKVITTGTEAKASSSSEKEGVEKLGSENE
jgi:hypothetical protein